MSRFDRAAELLETGGIERSRLDVYPLEGGEAREAFRGSEGGAFKYVGWSRTGDRLLAATADRRHSSICAPSVLMSYSTSR